MEWLKGLFGMKVPSYAPTDVKGYAIKGSDLSKLHKAAWNGDLAKVKQLARKDPSVLDKENRTPLHLVCVQGHASVVQELLEWNARTNIGDKKSQTPLMKAVECGQSRCVKLLLEYHTDVDQVDADGNTGLHLAVRDDNVAIAKSIIAAGADINTRNKMGYTPLHLSILNPSKRDELTRTLLVNDADPNIYDNNYETPLHHACNENAINLLKLLLQFNADTAAKNTKGWMAADLAMMKGHNECAQLLPDSVLVQNTMKRRSVPPSVTDTNRPGSSLRPSSYAPSTASFGLPQVPQMKGYCSEKPTVRHQKKLDSSEDKNNKEKLSHFLTSSEEVVENPCNFCLTRYNKYIESVHFCVDCDSNLCIACRTLHADFPSMKFHQVVCTSMDASDD